MIVRNIDDIKEFKKVIDSCEGDVCLKSIYGDVYNLKSELSQYVALADLVRDKNGDLELFASKSEDEAKLMAFLNKMSQQNNN